VGPTVNLSRTLEQLEGQVWPAPDIDTHLVLECHRLRKVPLNQFSVENLRIMIGQQVGLEHLLTIALEKLQVDPWLEGDYYPGDLLHAVVRVELEFWVRNEELRGRLDGIISELKSELESRRKLLEEKILPMWQRIYGG
jgi:hypothetical protein